MSRSTESLVPCRNRRGIRNACAPRDAAPARSRCICSDCEMVAADQLAETSSRQRPHESRPRDSAPSVGRAQLAHVSRNAFSGAALCRDARRIHPPWFQRVDEHVAVEIRRCLSHAMETRLRRNTTRRYSRVGLRLPAATGTRHRPSRSIQRHSDDGTAARCANSAK